MGFGELFAAAKAVVQGDRDATVYQPVSHAGVPQTAAERQTAILNTSKESLFAELRAMRDRLSQSQTPSDPAEKEIFESKKKVIDACIQELLRRDYPAEYQKKEKIPLLQDVLQGEHAKTNHYRVAPISRMAQMQSMFSRQLQVSEEAELVDRVCGFFGINVTQPNRTRVGGVTTSLLAK